jgi:hypothetical protein
VELTEKWSMDSRRESSSLLARRLPFRACIMNGGASPRLSLGLGGDLTFVDGQSYSRPAKPTKVKDDEWHFRSWQPFIVACLGSRRLANACPRGTK